jgi:2-polyprenyl-3-methyl-5-hydroxy-6-metoxy-1,4-benzoquinol methylase
MTAQGWRWTVAALIGVVVYLVVGPESKTLPQISASIDVAISNNTASSSEVLSALPASTLTTHVSVGDERQTVSDVSPPIIDDTPGTVDENATASGPTRPIEHHEPLRDERGRLVNPVRMMDKIRDDIFRCPRFHIHGNDADKKKSSEHISKYSRYAVDYCNSTGLMQMNIPQHAHIQMLSTIARIARVKENDRVLDWGCGCGTMLNYLHLRYNTTGVGIDMTEGAIRFAWQHSQPKQTFCWMDGSDMSAFPTSHFDAIVSWGGVYHVRRTQIQCSIVTHMVRILKPGGVAFVGHVRTDKSQQYWKQNKCTPPNSSVVRYRDYKTFRQNSWKRHGFFSIIVTKHNSDSNS